MKNAAQIRSQCSKHKQLRCELCGSAEDVERHHVGGRHHVAWFTVPLCRTHHVRLTAALRQAGIDMSYTLDKRERLARARKAILLFSWMLEEELEKYEEKEGQK
jgi:hypothetical protein